MLAHPTNVGNPPSHRQQGADVALQIMIPERLKREISVKAAKEGTTNRSIVLSALREAGFEVSDDEICDRRKARA